MAKISNVFDLHFVKVYESFCRMMLPEEERAAKSPVNDHPNFSDIQSLSVFYF